MEQLQVQGTCLMTRQDKTRQVHAVTDLRLLNYKAHQQLFLLGCLWRVCYPAYNIKMLSLHG